MALKIVINISKKVPISGIDYASTSASCTLEGEVASGQDPQAEAARLYRQAEQAVDTQLVLGANAKFAQAGSAVQSATPNPPLSSAQPSSNGGRGYPRRRPAVVTPSQLGLVIKLIKDTKTDPGAILAHYQASALNQLSVRDASELIDELKAREAGSAQR